MRTFRLLRKLYTHFIYTYTCIGSKWRYASEENFFLLRRRDREGTAIVDGEKKAQSEEDGAR